MLIFLTVLKNRIKVDLEAQEKIRIDKIEKIVYNSNEIGNKDILVMNKTKTKKNNPIKVTSSYLIENPTKKDIEELQKEVQHILLSNIHQNTIQSK